MTHIFYILVAAAICILSFFGGVVFHSKIEKRKFNQKKKILEKNHEKTLKKVENKILKINQEFLKTFEERHDNANRKQYYKSTRSR